MKKINLLLLLGTLCLQVITAQERKVSGKVSSGEDGQPLIGVNVFVKGTDKGTVTNIDGLYNIGVGTGETLIFKYVGYTPQEIRVMSDTTINVVMQPEVSSLDEVIVIGYGTQKKSDVTGSVVSVTADEVTQTPVAGIDQALQGRAAGVTVTSGSGQPGSGVMVRIRGIGTVNNSDPLYVVDGVFLSNINFLSPNDIQSVEILKDASATAIYGSRGANGVVLITTKKGTTSDKMNVTIDVYKGIQNRWRTLDLMNREQYAAFKGYDASDPTYSSFSDWVYTTFNLQTNPYIPTDINYEDYNTNWQDVVFRKNAPISNYYVIHFGHLN